jgi:ABC-type branched-subunit amino acid transport system permease subunit
MAASPRDGVMAVVVWVLACVLIVVFWRLERSPWGRVLQAIREDEAAAMAVGKNVISFKLQALILGAIVGAVAGLLLALEIGVFSPDDYQPTLTFYAYLILILGGMNRIWAIPFGAVLFSLLYTGTRFLNFYPLSLFDSGSRAFLRLFLVGLLLVLFVALRPEGVFGDRRQLLLEK